MKKQKLVLIVALILIASYLSRSPDIVPTRAAEEIPRDEAVYFYAFYTFAAPEVWNPYISTEMQWHGLHALEALFYFNQYTAEATPWQAESFTYEADYTRIILNLRKGVKWNDGTPFTADDVVFTYQMLLEYAPDLTYSPFVKETIKSVVKVDDYTVLFELTEPNPRAHYQMFYANWPIRIVPKHIWKDVDPTTFRNYPNPVMTGAYKVHSVDPTKVIMKRDDNWWGKDVFGFLPQAKYIVFTDGGAPMDKKIADMSENKFDWAYSFSEDPWKTMSAANPHLKRWVFGDTCPRGIQLNHNKYPWNLPEVKWAMSYAIDKTKLIDVGYEGLGRASRHPFPYYPGLEKFLFDDILEKYDTTVYDPDRGTAILKSLGWTKGDDGIWITDNGTRVQGEMYHFVGVEGWVLTVIDDLRAFGFDITRKAVEFAVFVDGVQRGRFDMWMAWACGLGVSNGWDPWGLYILFHSMYSDVPVGEKVALGIDTPAPGTRYHTDEFDDILDRLTAVSPDDPASLPIYREALEYFMKELPIITLVAAEDGIVTSDHYWTNWPSAENNYIHPYMHHATAYMMWVNVKSTKLEAIPMKIVYATQTIDRFLGANLKMYGPFSEGDQVTVPASDADNLVAAGAASPTKPLKVSDLVPIINDLQTSLTSLQSKVSSLESNIASLQSNISTVTMTAYAAIAIAVVLGIVAIAMSLKK